MLPRKEETQEVIDNLRRVFQAINEYSKSAEHMTGLTGPQLWTLKILEKSAPLRLTDLAHQMYLSSATVVGIIDRLEGKGLVTRNRSREDRRAVELELSKKGKEAVSNSPEVAQDILLKGLDELPDKQFSLVVNGMKLMARILAVEQVTPKPLLG